MKIVFWGTPDVSRDTLEILKSNGVLPELIITGLDKRQGRNLELTPPPVKTWAIDNNIKFLQPEDLRGLAPYLKDADLSVVVAYGRMIPKEILELPKMGSINIHYSLLPKYRGASPVESAVLDGETETGVSIQKMVYEMDKGDIIASEKTTILSNEKAVELKTRLIKIGANLLLRVLKQDSWTTTPQNENLATYASKIKKEDGEIDLQNDPPHLIYNKFRAFSVWPRIFFFKNNKRVIITDLGFENGKIIIKKVLPEGKKEIDYSLFEKTNI